MNVGAVLEKMILSSNGNLHDISHFLKVYAFARTIGKKEELDEATQEILEIAAAVHDIACPLCREKYGNTDGKNQEKESEPLVRQFFAELDIPEPVLDRVAYLVSHHHTYTNVDGMDYRILLEADFLVNADESAMPRSAVQASLTQVFRTETGKRLLCSLYSV